MKSRVSSSTQEWELRHSPSMDLVDLLTFVYLDEFMDDWKKLYGSDDDEESLWALEIAIMSAPDGPPVVPGTGGLRKLRFGSAEVSGKSGGNRICYAYFPEFYIVLMMLAYPKNRQINLTNEQKEGVREYLNQVKRWLESK